MRKYLLILWSSLLVLTAFGQDYKKMADDCFNKGDYDCAKRNYQSYQAFSGQNVSSQIQQSEECLKIRLLADAYYEEEEYGKALKQYEKILQINARDSYAQNKYDQLTGNQSGINVQDAKISPVIQAIYEDMVYAQGGTFMMGSKDKDAIESEKPIHKVTLSDFYIGQTEVTGRQWVEVMGAKPVYYPGDDYPVVAISWNDIQVFLSKLNQLTGKQYRLPTEAEWEFAARGGNNSRGYKYAGSNNVEEVAWYADNSDDVCAVRQKQGNELGLYDMSGNALELCADWYAGYSSASQTNPKGPSSGSERVMRGASTINQPELCSVTRRYSLDTGFRHTAIGFRLCMSADYPVL